MHIFELDTLRKQAKAACRFASQSEEAEHSRRIQQAISWKACKLNLVDALSQNAAALKVISRSVNRMQPKTLTSSHFRKIRVAEKIVRQIALTINSTRSLADHLVNVTHPLVDPGPTTPQKAMDFIQKLKDTYGAVFAMTASGKYCLGTVCVPTAPIDRKNSELRSTSMKSVPKQLGNKIIMLPTGIFVSANSVFAVPLTWIGSVNELPPHVNSDGGVCLGNQSRAALNAFNLGHHMDVIGILYKILHSWNDGDHYHDARYSNLMASCATCSSFLIEGRFTEIDGHYTCDNCQKGNLYIRDISLDPSRTYFDDLKGQNSRATLTPPIRRSHLTEPKPNLLKATQPPWLETTTKGRNMISTTTLQMPLPAMSIGEATQEYNKWGGPLMGRSGDFHPQVTATSILADDEDDEYEEDDDGDDFNDDDDDAEGRFPLGFYGNRPSA